MSAQKAWHCSKLCGEGKEVRKEAGLPGSHYISDGQLGEEKYAGHLPGQVSSQLQLSRGAAASSESLLAHMLQLWQLSGPSEHSCCHSQLASAAGRDQGQAVGS